MRGCKAGASGFADNLAGPLDKPMQRVTHGESDGHGEREWAWNAAPNQNPQHQVAHDGMADVERIAEIGETAAGAQ